MLFAASHTYKHLKNTHACALCTQMKSRLRCSFLIMDKVYESFGCCYFCTPSRTKLLTFKALLLRSYSIFQWPTYFFDATALRVLCTVANGYLYIQLLLLFSLKFHVVRFNVSYKRPFYLLVKYMHFSFLLLIIGRELRIILRFFSLLK